MKHSNGYLLIFFFLLSIASKAQNARIKIDPDRKIGEIRDLIYGNFIERPGPMRLWRTEVYIFLPATFVYHA